MQIHRHHSANAADDRVGLLEDAAVECAVAHRDDPFRIGGRGPAPLQGFVHIGRHRPGDQQHIGMARRGDKAQPEPLEVVERIVQRVDFQLAAIARAGIDLADRQAAAEPSAGGAVDLLGEFGEGDITCRRRRLGQRRRCQTAQKKLENSPASYRSCPE